MTLTKNTANATNLQRIRVNGIILGWVDTPGEHETLKKFMAPGENWLEEAEAGRPFGKLLKAADVARIVCFLASDESPDDRRRHRLRADRVRRLWRRLHRLSQQGLSTVTLSSLSP